MKKVDIKDGVKVLYLSYIGDVEIGECINIGCGFIIVNYDGVNKFKIIVGKDVFIGCNMNFIVFVIVGNYIFIVVGFIIIDNIFEDSLVLVCVR